MQEGKNRRRFRAMFFVGVFIGKLKRRIKKTKHRRFVLEEWREVEAAINYIKKPLVQKQFIAKKQIGILFPQFQGMLDLSKKMIDTVSIIKKQKNPNFIILGKDLAHFASFYKIYGTYFGNRLKSQQVLKSLAESHPEEMKEIQTNLRDYMKTIDARKQNITISDLLQQPQYRMFKYSLLMKDYLRKLPKDHKDYEPFGKALKLFEDINIANNDLMVKLESIAQKIKLDKLFGKSIQNNSQFIVKMTADSLNFPVKLYIFNNLIIISKIINTLGYEEEIRYLNLYLNQYSFIKAKPDLKYFKNVLFLCGQNQSLHCFLSDPGSRHEIIVAVQKVVKQLQLKAISRRQQKVGPNQNSSGKLSFAIQTIKKRVYSSQFRIEVLKNEVRPFSFFTNDTVYLTRFMAPMYIEDSQLFHEGRLKQPGEEDYLSLNGLWQLVQIHNSKVEQLIKELSIQYPQINFPEIALLTKEMNLFTESKKNTKQFQIRGYLFEEFFNYLFRHPIIIAQPFKWISGFKIIPSFWQYHCKKNDYLSGRDDSKKQNGYRYGAMHCELCKKVANFNLDQIQSLRRQLWQNPKAQRCFNTFNLVRLKTCQVAKTNFDSLQKILLYEMYEAGRLDYLFLPKEQLHNKYQQIKIIFLSSKTFLKVIIDYRRKVGQVLNEVGMAFGFDLCLDYRLVLSYEGKQRILDQDELIFDVVKKYNVPAEQKENSQLNSRQTFSQTSLEQKKGFFSFSLFETKLDSNIYVKKIIFLTKELEIKSVGGSKARAKHAAKQLFDKLLQKQVVLQRQDWGQVAAIWLILNKWGTVQGLNPKQSLNKVFEQIMPYSNKYLIEEKPFEKIYRETYQQISKSLKSQSHLQQAEEMSLIKRCIRIVYRSIKFYTYTIEVTAKLVPEQLISDGGGTVPQQCVLGVNYKQLLVFRDKQGSKPAVKLALEDIRVTNTTYSIFIEYSYFLSKPSQSSLQGGDISKSNLRFDTRMAYHFDQVLSIYRNLKRNFHQIIA